MKPNKTLRERMVRLLPAGVPRYVRAYDNGGASIDRYSVIFTGRAASKSSGGDYPYLAMNAAPFHPQGFGQHGSTKNRPADVSGGSWGGPSIGRKCHLGTRIVFDALPEDCRRLTVSDYCEIWGLPLPSEYLPEMVRAYLVAALWTEDDDAGPGDYEANGRPAELWHLWAPESIAKAREACARFAGSTTKQGVTMQTLWQSVGLDESQAGHDLWLSRNGHGSGFFDRANAHRDVNTCDRLQEGARNMGGSDLYTGDDGKLYFTP